MPVHRVFIFVAVMILVPMVYFVTAIASVQRSNLGQFRRRLAKRGRAFATGESTADAVARAAGGRTPRPSDQGLPGKTDADLRFVPGRCGCQSGQGRPVLAPGAVFAVCVVRHALLPGVRR